MDKSQILEFCLKKDGAYLDFPFAGNNYAVFKIKNEKTNKYRIFAEIFQLNNKDMLTFSTDSELAIMLRNQYQDIIIKGYHCPPVQAKYKSSVCIDCLDAITIQKFIDISYEYAKIKLKIT